jgi:hypothetical protein
MTRNRLEYGSIIDKAGDALGVAIWQSSRNNPGKRAY